MAKKRKTVNQIHAENELIQILRFIEKLEVKKVTLEETVERLEGER